MTLPPDFFALIPCLAGWPVSFFAGYQFGYRAGMLRGGVEPLPEPAARGRFPLPLTVYNQLVTELLPGEFARVEWGMLSTEKWRALWQSTATAHLAGAGRPFSRDELERTRDLLIARGVASWKDPAHHALGWELHPAMRRAIVRFVGGVTPSPTGLRLVSDRVQIRQDARTQGQKDGGGGGWELP